MALHFYPPCLLAGAAVAKSVQLATFRDSEQLLFGSRIATVALISFEIALASWLVSGWCFVRARQVAIAIFVLFAVVAATKAVLGDHDCGCFGVISVHPVVTFALDTVAIVCLCNRRFSAPLRSTRRSFIAATFAVTCALLCLLPTFAFKTTQMDEFGTIQRKNALVVLTPQDWLNKTLPIRRHVADAEFLDRGTWDVTLYVENCPHCEAHINDCLTRPPSTPHAFVGIPPLSRPARASSPQFRWTHLDKDLRWFVEAPVQLTVKEGIVTDVLTRNQLQH